MQKHFVFLVTLLVVLLGGISWLVFDNSSTVLSPSRMEGTLLLENGPVVRRLEDLKDVNLLEVKRDGETLLKAELVGNTWMAYQLDPQQGFAMESERAVHLIRQLAAAKIIQLKSNSQNHHAKLGLLLYTPERPEDVRLFAESPKATAEQKEGTGYLVRLESLTRSIEVIVGKKEQIREAQFVRFFKQNQMFLVDQVFDIPSAKYSWLIKDIMPIEQNEIVSVKSKYNNKQQWEIIKHKALLQPYSVASRNNSGKSLATRFKDGDFRFLDTLNPRDLVYPSIVNDYVSVLSDLTFKEVKRININRFNKMRLALQLTIESEQKTVQMTIREKGNRFFAQVIEQDHFSYLSNWQFELSDTDVKTLIRTKADFLAPSTD